MIRVFHKRVARLPQKTSRLFYSSIALQHQQQYRQLIVLCQRTPYRLLPRHSCLSCLALIHWYRNVAQLIRQRAVIKTLARLNPLHLSDKPA